jgi:protein-disulfide isomerase
MASGKTSARSRGSGRTKPPPPRSKGAPPGRQASPRVLIGGAAVVLAIVVAVVVGIVLISGSSNAVQNVPAVGSLANGLPGATAVNSLFNGVPQNGTTLGGSSAPVTLVEYIDLQCPYCQQFETQVMPDLITKYVRTGKVKIVMRPWAFIGPDSARGQAAVLAAANQDKAFNFAELLYDNQGTENSGWLTQQLVANTAASIPGLQVPKLLSAMSSAIVNAAVQQVDNQVKADNVSGTPTLFVGTTAANGRLVRLSSPTDEAAVVAAINSALAS